MLRRFGWIAWALLVFGLDWASKQWALSALAFLRFGVPFPFGGMAIWDASPYFTISLNLLTNQGTAWGLLADWPRLLLFLRTAILLVLIVLLGMNRVRPSWRIPLGLVIGGAAGNILDVFRYGAVLDFILVRFGNWSFPCFNVADSAICLGIGLLLLASWRDSDASC
ncbi:MAG: signal peptidase II [Chlamydiia bacterium]